MSIRVLPLQLISQIAAGEIIERPASVVKELIENSIDAGATQIYVDIDKGGAKMIRVRDNGQGILKEELLLALTKNATSKISKLEDLECIKSMGFRGEALASIHSVSRLTLTSRTWHQSEGWKIYTEGSRNVITPIQPIAHPLGTTVEVLDLFYNIPARKKFMRTEKTEFIYIDEIIRRIALSHFKITFILKHNGKIIRRYYAVSQKFTNLERLSKLCGSSVSNNILSISSSCKHSGLNIKGWIIDPTKKNFPRIQYSYINKRMIKNKLINQAIQEAYEAKINKPTFILFLDIDYHQVDVNVHPTKNEIKFHQSRLVHDFIYQAVMLTLQQQDKHNDIANDNSHFISPSQISIEHQNAPVSENQDSQVNSTIQDNDIYPSYRVNTNQENNIFQKYSEQETELKSSKILTLFPPYYALVESENNLVLLSLKKAAHYLTEHSILYYNGNILHIQFFTDPIRIVLHKEELSLFNRYQHVLQNLGFIFKKTSNIHEVILISSPLPIGNQNFNILIPKLLGYLYTHPSTKYQTIASWLSWYKYDNQPILWDISYAKKIINDMNRLYPQWKDIKPQPIKNLAIIININHAIQVLNHA